ncbi:hypothetical protein IWW38_004802, partial [Coemansia aciculifera]
YHGGIFVVIVICCCCFFWFGAESLSSWCIVGQWWCAQYGRHQGQDRAHAEFTARPKV